MKLSQDTYTANAYVYVSCNFLKIINKEKFLGTSYRYVVILESCSYRLMT